MATTLSDARQYKLTALAKVDFTDIADYATAAAAETFDLVELPANSMVTEIKYCLITSFADDASETQTMDVGTTEGGVTDDPNAFTSTAIDIDGTAQTISGDIAEAQVGMMIQYTEPVVITASFIPSVGAAALTAGLIHFVVTYIGETRQNENQG